MGVVLPVCHLSCAFLLYLLPQVVMGDGGLGHAGYLGIMPMPTSFLTWSLLLLSPTLSSES